MTIRFAAGVRSSSSYIPDSGSDVSFSATRYKVGTSRLQANARVAGRMPGFGREAPPGASATTDRIRGSTSTEASAVHPPRLCPTIPTLPGSTAA